MKEEAEFFDSQDSSVRQDIMKVSFSETHTMHIALHAYRKNYSEQ